MERVLRRLDGADRGAHVTIAEFRHDGWFDSVADGGDLASQLMDGGRGVVSSNPATTSRSWTSCIRKCTTDVERSTYRHPRACFTGDVTHAADWDAVLRLFRPSQIVHLAAETGTGQSLSHATRHASVNVVGTAQLLDALSRSALVPDQLVLASSRAVYGEGAWRCGTQTFYPRPRSQAQLLAGVGS